MSNSENGRLPRGQNTNMINLYFLFSGFLLLCFTLLISSCSPQINTPNPDSSKQPIPKSMKGYEIYSWHEDGGWVFKLITGTNRQKTIDEIMSDSEPIQEDTWTNIKINGVDNLKIILENLPKGEVSVLVVSKWN